ncbi:MAG: hypothetical protein MK085_11575 [Phycisphaerales bacterium]|nr:hypothetical protein [Phycisphaerales bacterium]
MAIPLAGCAHSPDAAGNETASLHPFGMPGGGWRVPASGADPATLPPPITIERGGSAVGGLAEPTIIDSSAWKPQIREADFYDGPLIRPAKLLPKHSRDKTVPRNAPNDLVAGKLNDRLRAEPVAAFPGVDQSPWRPPDPSIAVGPDHVVTVVNMELAWFTKDGTKEFQQRMDSTGEPGFFEDLGAGDFTFDPKCFYDPFVGRYVILALEVYRDSYESWMTFAVSDDDDPNGTWYKYRTWSVIDVDGVEYWNDYPGFGFDERAWYITANMFGFDGGAVGTLLRSIDKSGPVSGSEVAWNDVVLGNFSWQVGHAMDADDDARFVRRAGDARLRVGALDDPLGAAVFSSSGVDVPQSDLRSDAPTGVGPGLWVLDGRMMNVFIRDDRLWTCHAIQPPGQSNVVGRWYEIDLAGTPALLQSGDIDLGGSEFTFFPAVAVNAFGAVGIVYGHSSASLNPTLEAVGRLPEDPLGTMSAPTILAESVTSPDDGSDSLQRWGDYFDCTVDPVDERTFWMTGETQTSNGWQTQIITFTIGLPADLNGDGNVDGADLGLLLNAWGTPGPGDLDGSGLVDGGDIGLMLVEWN